MSSHPDQLRYKAMTLIEDRQFAPALAVFEKLVPLTDNTWDYLWRAKLNLVLGNYVAALHEYEVVLLREPSEYSALHHSALILAASPGPAVRNGVRALELATRALETSNANDWMTLSVIAAAHAECGDFVRAAEVAGQVLKIAPDKYRTRFTQRREQYERHEPFRISAEYIQQNTDFEPKVCVQCGAPTFFSIPESDSDRVCLCIRCASHSNDA